MELRCGFGLIGQALFWVGRWLFGLELGSQLDEHGMDKYGQEVADSEEDRCWNGREYTGNMV